MSSSNEIMPEHFHLTQNILVAAIIMGLLALVCLVGNIILLRSLVIYRNLRVNLYVIIAGMAVADLLHLVIAVPARIMNMLQAFDYITDTWCKASRYIMNATSYVAAYHLVIMCVLRGIMLTNRGNSSPTGRHTFYCSIIVWVVGILATVPVIQIWTKFDLCYRAIGVDEIKEVWLSSCFSCFVPIGMIVLVYSTTYYIGKRYFADSYSRHEKQMSRLVTAVVMSFVICEVPSNILSIVITSKSPGTDITDLLTIEDFLLCLLLFDKALRPVLYSKLSSDLGECFDEVINCTFCHRYYSDGPKRVLNTQSSRAPLTNEGTIEICCEEIV